MDTIKNAVKSGCKKIGVKRTWYLKKLNQVFFQLNKESIKKSIIYSQLAIVIIRLTPNSTFASMTPVIVLGDSAQVAEKLKKHVPSCVN